MQRQASGPRGCRARGEQILSKGVCVCVCVCVCVYISKGPEATESLNAGACFRLTVACLHTGCLSACFSFLVCFSVAQGGEVGEWSRVRSCFGLCCFWQLLRKSINMLGSHHAVLGNNRKLILANAIGQGRNETKGSISG